MKPAVRTSTSASSGSPRSDPQRTCIGCRCRTSATDLLRVVAADGTAVPDVRRRLPGRGAWVHPTPACVALAERRRAFGRALRQAGPLDPTPVREYVAERTGEVHQSGQPQEMKTHGRAMKRQQ
ncbi:MAG: YlxR family protein [Jatrophihabitans sp.]|uniref:YlxR family protein n=1 Tax=Jatrophihabitans sp. TaxID=1932789 RepID=UPI003F7DDEC4